MLLYIEAIRKLQSDRPKFEALSSTSVFMSASVTKDDIEKAGEPPLLDFYGCDVES